MKTEPQKKRILQALLKGSKLTPIRALTWFGSFRLGARIFDLREDGWPIEKKMLKVKDGTYVAQYYITNESLIKLNKS